LGVIIGDLGSNPAYNRLTAQCSAQAGIGPFPFLQQPKSALNDITIYQEWRKNFISKYAVSANLSITV